jgi:alkanesulfonate monooxygenase SsuD/methylene tetrahydromethanopterin reductase-like flavin-dependent oxidoreductase (luciferase family)
MPGKPLADTRSFLEKFRAQDGFGPLPPIIVAALRKRMVALSGELAEGVVFANASLSHMAESLAALPAAKRDDPDFFIGNMIPTCIGDDVEAAKAVNRRTLSNYVFLPNYRNYWKEAGYVEEMEAIEKAIAQGRREEVRNISDKWLADNTLWAGGQSARASPPGVRQECTADLVPSSATGNQMKAIEEVFAVRLRRLACRRGADARER